MFSGDAICCFDRAIQFWTAVHSAKYTEFFWLKGVLLVLFIPGTLSARGFLDASSQRGGFTCFTTRRSSVLQSRSRENDMYVRTFCTLRADTDITKSWDLTHRTRVVISAIKTHTYIYAYLGHKIPLHNKWSFLTVYVDFQVSGVILVNICFTFPFFDMLLISIRERSTLSSDSVHGGTGFGYNLAKVVDCGILPLASI